MGGFKRALLGYRRSEVDAAIGERDARISALQQEVADAVERWQEAAAITERAERELADLSGMVIDREREIRVLNRQLDDANARHERSIVSLEAVARRLEDIQTQARGQATRIRMKALREAVEVGRRAQQLAAAELSAEATSANVGERGSTEPGGADPAGAPSQSYEGQVKLEIGPLGDFSQLVGIEDAISRLGASEISVERFSEGRATLSMRLEKPVDLLRELEERAPMEFRVRRTADDNLILDVDEDQEPDQRAA